MVNAAVIVFPGSNCDRDLISTFTAISGKKPHIIWHAETSLPSNIDVIGIPGGFSYGDYLRSGAIAARSPIMQEVIKAAGRGVYILGICNGFQVLTESGLLPGVLMRNKYLRFICKKTILKPVNTDTAFTKYYKKTPTITLPIAHHDGNYFADDETVTKLEGNGQIAFQYCTPDGNFSESANPNGSKHHIAGIFSDNKRILGMMPHPERACDPLTAGTDGINLFKSLLAV
jgi:phosphoribosylformylglycinamidine synthase subunit PurQ / glutaminase